MSETTSPVCFFNCNRNDPLITGGQDSIRTIVSCSKERDDNLQLVIDRGLEDGSLQNLANSKEYIFKNFTSF